MPNQREIINNQIQLESNVLVDRYGDVWYVNSGYSFAQPKQSLIPQKIQGISNVKTLFKSDLIVLKQDHTAWQIDLNTMTAKPIAALNNVKQILYADVGCLLLYSDGTLWTSTNVYTDRIRVPGAQDFVQIGNAEYWVGRPGDQYKRKATCALKKDGTLWCLSDGLNYVRDTADFTELFEFGVAVRRDGSFWEYDGSTFKKIRDPNPTCPATLRDNLSRYYYRSEYEHIANIVAVSGRYAITADDLLYLFTGKKIGICNVLGVIDTNVSNTYYILKDYSVWIELPTKNVACIFRDGITEAEYPRHDTNNNIVALSPSQPLEILGKLDVLSEYHWYAMRVQAGTYQINIPNNDVTGICAELHWEKDLLFPERNNKIHKYKLSTSDHSSFLASEDQLVYMKVYHNTTKPFYTKNYVIHIEQKEFTGKTKMVTDPNGCSLLAEDGSLWEWSANSSYSQVAHIKQVKDIFVDASTAYKVILYNDGVLQGKPITLPLATTPNIVYYYKKWALDDKGTLFHHYTYFPPINNENVKCFGVISDPEIVLLKHDNTLWYHRYRLTTHAVQIPSPGTVTQLSGRYALTDNGRVWILVVESRGSKLITAEYQLIEGLENIIHISEEAQLLFALFLDQGGNVWDYTHGDINGRGKKVTKIQGLNSIVSISQADNGQYAFLIDSSGDVWQYNREGIKQIAISDVRMLSNGRTCRLAMKNDGSIWGWGNNCFCTDMPNVPSFADPVACMGMTGPGDDYPADFGDLPIIKLPEDQVPVHLTGVIDYAADNDSFAMSAALDSRYKIEFICDSPHVKPQFYQGSTKINGSLPLEGVIYKDSVFYIRVYHLANKPFTAASFTIKLTRLVDSVSETTPLTVVAGQSYTVPLFGKAIPFIEGRLLDRIHVNYDPNTLQLVNPASQNEPYSFPHKIVLMEQSPGKLILRKSMNVSMNNRDYEWTGQISALEFKALATGTTQIETVSEF